MKSKQKLQAAAISLFTSQGYEQTTIKDIAQLAGVTERTFFRQFKDKADIFFESKSQLFDEINTYLLAHYQDDTPLFDLLINALKSVQVFDENRPRTLMRAEIIQSHPDLMERELLKGYALKGHLLETLVNLQLTEDKIKLELDLSIALQIMDIAYQEWLEHSTGTFADSIGLVLSKYRD